MHLLDLGTVTFKNCYIKHTLNSQFKGQYDSECLKAIFHLHRGEYYLGCGVSILNSICYYSDRNEDTKWAYFMVSTVLSVIYLWCNLFKMVSCALLQNSLIKPNRSLQPLRLVLAGPESPLVPWWIPLLIGIDKTSSSIGNKWVQLVLELLDN